MEQGGDQVGGVPAVRPAAETVLPLVQFQAGGAVIVKRAAGETVADFQAVELGGSCALPEINTSPAG